MANQLFAPVILNSFQIRHLTLYSIIISNISKKFLFITGLIAIVLGVYSFGKPFIFDRIYLVLLICASVYSYHIDRNTFGIFVILALERIFEESMYMLNSDDIGFKLLVIFLCGFACYKLRYDRMIWIAVGALASLLLAEIYWFYIDYPTPRIYWSIVILFENLMVRHFIFFRPAIMEQRFPAWKDIRWIHTDWQIYQLMLVFVVVESARLIEYYVRHIAGFKHIQIIYDSYAYVAHVIACFVIWIVLNEMIRITRERYLVA